MRVEVWKCRKTGSLFEETIDYRRHLCRRSAARWVKRSRIARLAKADEVMRDRYRLGSFHEIEEWLVANGRLLYERQIVHNSTSYRLQKSKGKIPEDFCFKEFTFRNMRWSDCCSNSHNAPAGKPQNWAGKDHLPKGYPGWKGSIRFYLKGYSNFSSDILDGTAIHAGSGGGGGYLTYDVTLFAEEWPMLAMNEGLVGDPRNGLVILEGRVT
jgi:hypothetical protein